MQINMKCKTEAFNFEVVLFKKKKRKKEIRSGMKVEVQGAKFGFCNGLLWKKAVLRLAQILVSARPHA